MMASVKYIDNCKGILMFLVVFSHIIEPFRSKVSQVHIWLHAVGTATEPDVEQVTMTFSPISVSENS